MLYPAAAILAGFLILIWSADRFVIGAAGTAKNLGMSPMLIGLTIVSLGTSAPEMLVSSIAAYTDSGGLAIGNALGS
ncbi:MAG: calcium/sodium antiporter, partial [Motiliproteus sp.]|nr:calcium/sodium antiporter [Motiliproteus sp.]